MANEENIKSNKCCVRREAQILRAAISFRATELGFRN